MIDLSTTYLGLKLKNPLVIAPSPLCEDLGNIRRAEDSGAGAIVLHSLFEEQIAVETEQLDKFLDSGAESFAESLTYLPDMTSYNLGPDAYLEHLRRAKQAVKIPIIASLNGISSGGWTDYAKYMEEAGADALELNVYYIATRSAMSSAAVEQTYYDLVRQVKASVKIPVAVKIGPYFSSMAQVAQELENAGADGMVMFNRFYQPDFDLEALEVKPNLHLSQAYELLLRLNWVAILYGQVKLDMAITGGVHTAIEVLKSMMAGAKVVMMASALLKHGVEHVQTMKTDLLGWMEKHEYTSIAEMQGSLSRKAVADPTAFERANYMKVISSYALRPPMR